MKSHFYGIFILALVMIILPLHLRFAHNNPTLAGTEPYYHARMAIQISEGKTTETDTAITGGRLYKTNPYHIFLAVSYKLLGPLAFNLIPPLLSLTSFIFVWLLLRRLEVPQTIQPWVLLAYALSPPLMATSALGTPHPFVLALLTSGSWLLLNHWWVAGLIAIIIASISGPVYAIAAIVFLLILILTLKKGTRNLTITALVSLIILVLGYAPSYIQHSRAVSEYISDLGGTYGFSIFALLLAVVGAVLIWEHKRKYYGAYALFMLFLISSFFFPGLLVFANVLVSGLAGVALASLAQRKWELKFLRQAALLVLFCGLLFSGISHAVILADTPPTQTFFKAIEFPPGTIFTHEQYGFWVEAAGHKAVTDPLWKELAEPEERAWDTAALFSSTDPKKTNALLKKYNVTHLLITPEMEHGLVWEREEQGLDFLVENSETFKKLETGSNIAVYRVT
jgi:hypothetical protein